MAVWNVKSPTDITLRMTLKGHKGRVWSVDLTKTTIISGSQDETIKVQSCMYAVITYNRKCFAEMHNYD